MSSEHVSRPWIKETLQLISIGTHNTYAHHFPSDQPHRKHPLLTPQTSDSAAGKQKISQGIKHKRDNNTLLIWYKMTKHSQLVAFSWLVLLILTYLVNCNEKMTWPSFISSLYNSQTYNTKYLVYSTVIGISFLYRQVLLTYLPSQGFWNEPLFCDL